MQYKSRQSKSRYANISQYNPILDKTKANTIQDNTTQYNPIWGKLIQYMIRGDMVIQDNTRQAKLF